MSQARTHLVPWGSRRAQLQREDMAPDALKRLSQSFVSQPEVDTSTLKAPGAAIEPTVEPLYEPYEPGKVCLGLLKTRHRLKDTHDLKQKTVYIRLYKLT